MSGSTLAFLTFLAAMTAIVGQLCFFAYDISKAKDELRHRVDRFSAGRWARERASGSRRRGRSDEPGRLTSVVLKGDELEFARQIERLGVPAVYAPPLYLALRLAVGGGLAAVAALLGYHYVDIRQTTSLLGLGALAAALGWSIPHLVTNRLAVRRKRAITRGLPEAIELLVIAVQAGLSLEDAINRIVVELRAAQPIVAAELALTSADLQILPNRDDALARLAERVDLPSVHSVVTTLTQTLRYGTPLAQALQVVASELRDDSLVRLEEQANRMPVLLTIPMMVFILPSLLLIIGGPAFLKILDAYMNFHR